MVLHDRGWPAYLTLDEIVVRPLARSDARAWRAARRRSAAWLHPWDATPPPGTSSRPTTFSTLVKRMRRQAKEGVTYPFAIDVDDGGGPQFAGQISVNNIVRGSAQFASIGYWIDQKYAGRGIMPRAVAMVIDHCLTTAGLHRVEICIRPENSNSLRVMEKLGIREVGYAPRFLHIDGAWRDHRLFAITKEECPEGLVARLRSASS